MCVAAPARIVEIRSRSEVSIPATVMVGPRRREVDLVMVPAACVGDMVLVHSGYGISLLDRDDAEVRSSWLGL